MLLLDRYIQIHRLESVSGNNTAYKTLTTSIEATRQPLGDEKTEMYGGSYGKMFIFFMDVDKDIQEGDRVKDDNGIYEIVAGGINNRNDGLISDYLSVVVKKIR